MKRNFHRHVFNFEIPFISLVSKPRNGQKDLREILPRPPSLGPFSIQHLWEISLVSKDRNEVSLARYWQVESSYCVAGISVSFRCTAMMYNNWITVELYREIYQAYFQRHHRCRDACPLSTQSGDYKYGYLVNETAVRSEVRSEMSLLLKGGPELVSFWNWL